jgi:NADPH-dependent 7-cyano-7-deazaguanine reductase QueF-like protein
MENYFIFLLILILIIFVSGCISQEEKVSSNVGLSAALTSDAKKIATSSPVTFILTVKNLASEPAKDISVELTNLTGWNVENKMQSLPKLVTNDLYKFSWLAYSPATGNKSFLATADVFYKMDSKAMLKVRVYNNDYLNTLNQEEREKIKSKSALLSSSISSNTPLKISISLQQPFILAQSSQNFPFVINIKNAGLGKVYSSYSTYPPAPRDEEYFVFSYSSNSTLQCDFANNEVVKLVNGSKSIACKISASGIEKYSDFSINFTLSYSYFDKVKREIEVA